MQDKFTLTKEQAESQNEELLKTAMDALYATYVVSPTVAARRGDAIQAINAMARALGFAHLVRND